MTSKITTELAVDDALVMDANYRFNPTDRRYIDDQVRGIEQHLVDALIKGRHGSWYTLDGSSAAVVAGDTVCLASTATGTVTKSTVATLANAKAAAGIVVYAANPGGYVFVAFGGTLSPSITGLGAAAGFVRVDTATSRCERVAAVSSTDYGLGYVDAAGWLQVGALFVNGLTSTTVIAGDGGDTAQVTAGTVQNRAGPKINDDDVAISQSTSDATITNIYTFATSSDRIYSIRGIVTVQNTDITKYGEYTLKGSWTNDSGVITARHAGTGVTEEYESDAGLTVTLDFTGTTLRVRVTGIAATDLRWHARIYLHEGLY